MEEIVNRIAKSNLITIDLEDLHHPAERILLDIKDQLYQGLILREKDFRDFINNTDWSEYTGKNVAIYCSSDAIIPDWAYMLLTNALQPYVNMVVFGDLQTLERRLFNEAINNLDFNSFKDAKVVIKGCSDKEIPTAAYVELTRKLTPIVASLMFGEPCSTVPVYKRRKTSNP